MTSSQLIPRRTHNVIFHSVLTCLVKLASVVGEKLFVALHDVGPFRELKNRIIDF